MEHYLIFDGTSYYVGSEFDKSLALQDGGEVVGSGTDFNFLHDECDLLNQSV